MTYKYKIQYTIFVLGLCGAFAWLLNLEFDRIAAIDAAHKTTPKARPNPIARLIAPAAPQPVIVLNPAPPPPPNPSPASTTPPVVPSSSASTSPSASDASTSTGPSVTPPASTTPPAGDASTSSPRQDRPDNSRTGRRQPRPNEIRI